MLRLVLLGSAMMLLAVGAVGQGRAADLAVRDAAAASRCLGPEAPDLFCRHYGYRRNSAAYARCVSIIFGHGLGPALSNGYTINFDWLKQLPPRDCRPPRLVIAPPENRPL